MNRTQLNLKEKTARGLLWGGISNAAQQILNLFFGIYLARILTVDDYGMVGVLTLFTAIASSLQESGFISGLTNKKEVSNEDYNAVFWCSIIIGTTVYLLLFISAPLLADFYNIPELTPLARYLFLSFLISSFGTAHSAFLFRNLMVKQRAIALITALTISGTLGVVMAYNGCGYWGIATQTLIYVTVVTGMLWLFSKWRPFFTINLSPVKEILGFSSKILFTNIFSHINTHVFSVFLGRFYTKHEVGLFGQANKWSLMGSSLVKEMVHSVAQPVLSNVSNDSERQQRVFKKMLQFTSFISFPALFGLSLIAEDLIVVTITDKWVASARLLSLLAIGGAFLPLSHLYINLIISRGKSAVYMWGTITLGIVQTSLLLITSPLGIYSMIAGYIGLNICWLFIWHILASRLLRVQLKDLLQSILSYGFLSALIMYSTYLVTLQIRSPLYSLIVKIVIAAFCYFFVLFLFKNKILMESYNYLREQLQKNKKK